MSADYSMMLQSASAARKGAQALYLMIVGAEMDCLNDKREYTRLSSRISADYQKQYDRLKAMDAKALARKLPAHAKGHKMPGRPPFVPNQPARFPAWITRSAGMHMVERPADCFPSAADANAGTVAYIKAFESLNLHKPVEYVLVSGALFPDASPEPMPAAPEPMPAKPQAPAPRVPRAPEPLPMPAPAARARRFIITADGRRRAA